MRRALIALAIVGAMSGRAQAQSMPVDVEERSTAGWSFTPAVSFGGAWDSGIDTSSNPFVENVLQRWVGLVSPSANLNYGGQRGSFNAGYWGSFEKYWSADTIWDQHIRAGSSYAASRRLSVSADVGYSAVPTTDRLELVEGTVPYLPVDASWLDTGGGLAYQLGRRTNVDLSYRFVRVAIDHPVEAGGFGTLRDGHSHSPSLGLMHSVTQRLAIGGRGELRREYIEGVGDPVIEGTEESFNVGSVTGEFSYSLSPVTIINGGGGISQLEVVQAGLSTLAPTYHGGIDHQARRFRINASYRHSFEQLFGFGTLGTANSFYGSITVPLADRLYYLKGSAAYSRTRGVEEIGTAFNFDSLWMNATVGRQLSQWVRAEGFVSVANQRQQIGFWPGANRFRFGVQFVTSKLMRMQ